MQEQGIKVVRGKPKCDAHSACVAMEAGINSGAMVILPDGSEFVPCIRLTDKNIIEIYHCPWCGERINFRPNLVTKEQEGVRIN